MSDWMYYALIWVVIIAFVALVVFAVSLFGLSDSASEFAVLVICVAAVWLFERSRRK